MAIAQMIESTTTNIYLNNQEEGQINALFLHKCKKLIDFYQSEEGLSEKELLKALKQKGGWFSELTNTKIQHMISSYWWVLSQEMSEQDLSLFTSEAFQKFLKLKDKVKTKIWEIFNCEENHDYEGIITTKILAKLKDHAIAEMSQLGAIAVLACEQEGKAGLIARKIISEVTQKIEKTDEETQASLLKISAEIAETTNIADTESLKSFKGQMLAAEELLANQVPFEEVKKALEQDILEPSGESFSLLGKFNASLSKTKQKGESLISSTKQVSGKIREELEEKLNALGNIQLALDFNL